MGVDAYRTRSARPDYPAEARPRPPVRQSVSSRLVGRGEDARCEAAVVYDFDAPSAADDHEVYRPPPWLTDARAAKVAYAVIIAGIAGMVIVFVLGFRH